MKIRIDDKDEKQIIRRVAAQIDRETVGVDCARGEVEISYRHMIVNVTYDLRRVFNDGWYVGPDEEPENRSKTYLSIIEGNIYTEDGDEVPNTVDFTKVEDYFDSDASIDYRDER